MSSKAVPQAYRSIIDKVINSVRPDFEENGIDDAVLQALQHSWEAKLAMSRVSDFSSDPRMGAYQKMLPPLEPPPVKSAPIASASTSTSTLTSKAEDESKPSSDLAKPEEPTATAAQASSSKSSKPSSNSTSSNSKKPAIDPTSNEINSDLDDSSDEDLFSDQDDNDADEVNGNGGGAGGSNEGDVIIALYEKVQRVKSKWKITLKDGVISVEGKDYLFSKCQGDFEWS